MARRGTTEFVQRTSTPAKGNKYYTQSGSGGYSKCILGNTQYINPISWKGCVLPNCVGYACGRFNEIEGSDAKAKTWQLNCNAKDFASRARSIGYTVGMTPAVGAIMVWGNSGAGHVAVVEKVVSSTEVVISQSGWSSKQLFWRATRKKGKNGLWCDGESWAQGRYSDFRGFIYAKNFAPETLDSDLTSQPAQQDTALEEYNEQVYQQYQTVVSQNYNEIKGQDLLSSTSLVESPFIIAKIGDYTFGSYTKEGSIEKANSTAKVTYPNYMKSISINKTNGVLNVYELKMVYQIIPGKDPNLLDRVFSTISNSREITLSYGDWCAPSFIYKEEQAIVTKVTSNIDFASQCINYTLSCTSKALAASAQTFHFDAYSSSNKKKGSDIIKGLLASKKYGLADVFTAMNDSQFVADMGLIPGDDKPIETEARDMTVIQYLNYIVGCMSSATNDDSTVIKDSTYHLIINDDIKGLYFKICKVGTTTRTKTSSDVYEIDIGYPTSTLVTSFDINTDNSWAILYKYDEKVDLNNYRYDVGDDGKIYSDYVQSSSALSAYYKRVTEIDKTWWTRMTQFPITATLTIKGLLRPAILMNYLRINTYFYGQKHISSGMYIITKQEDTIDANGYKTTLSLTRIAGDEDETQNFSQLAVVNMKNTSYTK